MKMISSQYLSILSENVTGVSLLKDNMETLRWMLVFVQVSSLTTLCLDFYQISASYLTNCCSVKNTDRLLCKSCVSARPHRSSGCFFWRCFVSNVFRFSFLFPPVRLFCLGFPSGSVSSILFLNVVHGSVRHKRPPSLSACALDVDI